MFIARQLAVVPLILAVFPWKRAMPRNDFLDLLKGSLITLVCIGHAIQYVIHADKGFFPDPFFKAIYMFHMPLFVAVAGYLSHRGITAAQSKFQYVLRRSTALILPIVSWTVIEHSYRYFFLNQPLSLSVIFGYTGLDRLWFLWILIESIAVTAVAVMFGRYQLLVLMLFFAAMLLLPDKSHLYLLKYVFPFFVIGFYTAQFDLTGMLAGRIRFLLPVLALASVLSFLVWNERTYIYVSMMSLTGGNLATICFRWLAGIIVSAFFVLLLWTGRAFIPELIRKNLEHAGRGSIYVYIIQSYVFIVLLFIVERYFGPVTNRLLSVPVAIGVGYAAMLFSLFAGELLAGKRVPARLLFGRSSV